MSQVLSQTTVFTMTYNEIKRSLWFFYEDLYEFLQKKDREAAGERYALNTQNTQRKHILQM